MVKHIQGRVPAAQLEPRVNDVIHTDDSKISGKLTAQSFRVHTAQFGEQALKLADARSLRSGPAAVAEELQNWPLAPATLMAYQQQYGKEMTFNLTGFPVGSGQQASVWGTDMYTLDSNLPAAAVHAGIAKPNEDGHGAGADHPVAAAVRGKLPQWAELDRLRQLQRGGFRVREEVIHR